MVNGTKTLAEAIAAGRSLELNTIVIIILAVLGASLGSFFNVLIYRMPRKKSIVYPPSHCGNCNKSIPIWLNIPVISYLILGGKCKYCGAKIHWHHLLVELITPILFIAIYLRFKDGMYPDNLFVMLKYLILVSFLIPIFFIDLFEQLILHKMTMPLIGLGLILSLFPYSDTGFLNSFISGAFIFALMATIAWLYSIAKKLDGLGGGDIWLMTALAVFFGFLNIPFVIILASLFGLIYYVIFVRSKEKVFAFGPFLVLASIIWILIGDMIMELIM